MKKKISWNSIKPETQSVWGGEIETFPHGATQAPTVNSVAYGYDKSDVQTIDVVKEYIVDLSAGEIDN